MPIDGLARALSGIVPKKARDYMDDLMPGKARDAIGALGDPEYWRLVRNNFGEAARGAARGISTNMVGAPVDLVNTAYVPIMGALGHPIDPAQTVGSSQWFAQQGDKRGLLPTGDSVPFKAGETLGPIAAGAAPDALGLMTAGAGKVADVAGQMASDYTRASAPVSGQIGAITYHGSPHKFDAFDISKIGTGEGAQAYGHGLYVAENPEVAKQYAVNLSNIDPNTARATAHANAKTWVERLGDEDYAKEVFRDKASEALRNGEDATPFQDTLRFLESGDYKRPLENQGHLYTADLPDEHIARMLDWDKPLSEQPESVRESVRGALVDRGISPSVAGYIVENKTGNEALATLARGQYDARLNVPDGQMAADASKRLLASGVPGIKYLDAGSRSAGEGSRNYVVFDDKLLKILERNGAPVGK